MTCSAVPWTAVLVDDVTALPAACCGVFLTRRIASQYSAASFIETVNATSLTIDPDEFMARMVAAGIPDMQLAPNSNAPALMTRTSNSNIAGWAALRICLSCCPFRLSAHDLSLQ